jgi:hypothetical protein
MRLYRADDDNLQATAICTYYLCQQVGSIVGTAASSVALNMIFMNTLEDCLIGIPNKQEEQDPNRRIY